MHITASLLLLGPRFAVAVVGRLLYFAASQVHSDFHFFGTDFHFLICNSSNYRTPSSARVFLHHQNQCGGPGVGAAVFAAYPRSATGQHVSGPEEPNIPAGDRAHYLQGCGGRFEAYHLPADEKNQGPAPVLSWLVVGCGGGVFSFGRDCGTNTKISPKKSKSVDENQRIQTEQSVPRSRTGSCWNEVFVQMVVSWTNLTEFSLRAMYRRAGESLSQRKYYQLQLYLRVTSSPRR